MYVVSRQPWWALLALVLLSGCTTSAGPTGQPSTTSTAATAVTTSTTVAAPAPRTENWFDLDVGDCLLQPPPEDPNVIEVPVVDCATAHRAEVFLRAPLAVNTALADVADRACGAGFTTYTGQQVSSSPFAVSYLIDSNQNRTSSNPLPSAVICLLTAADGTPLTGTARR